LALPPRLKHPRNPKPPLESLLPSSVSGRHHQTIAIAIAGAVLRDASRTGRRIQALPTSRTAILQAPKNADKPDDLARVKLIKVAVLMAIDVPEEKSRLRARTRKSIAARQSLDQMSPQIPRTIRADLANARMM
jgi:hypothetical protein